MIQDMGCDSRTVPAGHPAVPSNRRAKMIGYGLLIALVIAVATVATLTIRPCVARLLRQVQQMNQSHSNPFRKSHRPVEEHTWVGSTETALRKMFGPPKRVVSGYEAVGPKDRPKPPGPYRTLIYEHPDGFLFVWLNDPGNGFVCFDSLWFNRDVKF